MKLLSDYQLERRSKQPTKTVYVVCDLDGDVYWDAFTSELAANFIVNQLRQEKGLDVYIEEHEIPKRDNWFGKFYVGAAL